jgi:NAD(P)H-dependent FMN reductase
MAPPPVAILLISGSLREGSTNTALLRTAQAMTPEGVLTMLYDELAELPHFNPDDDVEGEPLPPVPARLRELLEQSDAVLFCTPEYAGELPGSLKNLLDWTVGGGTYEKPVAWINASGSPTRAEGAHAALRTVLQYTNADIVEGACTRIPVSRNGIGKDGLVADARVRSGVAWVLRSLADYVQAKRREQAERERLGQG